jgi:hypothetical protein
MTGGLSDCGCTYAVSNSTKEDVIVSLGNDRAIAVVYRVFLRYSIRSLDEVASVLVRYGLRRYIIMAAD